MSQLASEAVAAGVHKTATCVALGAQAPLWNES